MKKSSFRKILIYLLTLLIFSQLCYGGLMDVYRKYRLLKQLRNPKSFQKFGNTAKMAFEILDKDKDGIVNNEELELMKEQIVKHNLDQSGAIQDYIDSLSSENGQSCNQLVEKFKKKVGFRMISSFQGSENIPMIPVVVPMNPLVGYVMDKKISLDSFDIKNISTVKEARLVFSFTDFEALSHMQITFNGTSLGTLDGTDKCDGNWTDFPVNVPLNLLQEKRNILSLSSYDMAKDEETGEMKRVNPNLLMMRSRLELERNSSVIFFRMPSLPDQGSRGYSKKKVNPIKDIGLVQPGAEYRFELLINDHALLKPGSLIDYSWEFSEPDDTDNYGVVSGSIPVTFDVPPVFPNSAEPSYSFKTLKKRYRVRLKLNFTVVVPSAENPLYEEREVIIERYFKGVEEEKDQDREISLICLSSDLKFKKESTFKKAYDVDFVDENIDHSWELLIHLPIFDETSTDIVPDKIRNAQKVQDFLEKYKGCKKGTLSYQIIWGDEENKEEPPWLPIAMETSDKEVNFTEILKRKYSLANFFVGNQHSDEIKEKFKKEPYTLRVNVRYIAKEWVWDEGLQDFIAFESPEYRKISVTRKIFVKDSIPPWIVYSEGSESIFSGNIFYTGDKVFINGWIEETALFQAKLKLMNDNDEVITIIPLTVEADAENENLWKFSSHIKMPANLANKPHITDGNQKLWAGVEIVDFMGNINPYGIKKSNSVVLPMDESVIPLTTQKNWISVVDNDPPSIWVNIQCRDGQNRLYVLSEEVEDSGVEEIFSPVVIKCEGLSGKAPKGINPFQSETKYLAEFIDPLEVSEGTRIQIKVHTRDNVDNEDIGRIKIFLNESELSVSNGEECNASVIMRRDGKNWINIECEDLPGEDSRVCVQKLGIPIIVKNVQTRFNTLK